MNASSPPSITLLFLEENPILRDTLHIGMEACWPGCVVVAPADMGQIVPLLGRISPAVVILDMDMHDANSWHVLLSDVRKSSRVPVLLLGLYEEEAVKESVQCLGMVDYLVKPFGPDALTQRIRCLLENWEEERSSYPGISQGTK